MHGIIILLAGVRACVCMVESKFMYSPFFSATLASTHVRGVDFGQAQSLHIGCQHYQQIGGHLLADTDAHVARTARAGGIGPLGCIGVVFDHCCAIGCINIVFDTLVCICIIFGLCSALSRIYVIFDTFMCTRINFSLEADNAPVAFGFRGYIRSH